MHDRGIKEKMIHGAVPYEPDHQIAQGLLSNPVAKYEPINTPIGDGSKLFLPNGSIYQHIDLKGLPYPTAEKDIRFYDESLSKQPFIRTFQRNGEGLEAVIHFPETLLDVRNVHKKTSVQYRVFKKGFKTLFEHLATIEGVDPFGLRYLTEPDHCMHGDVGIPHIVGAVKIHYNPEGEKSADSLEHTIKSFTNLYADKTHGAQFNFIFNWLATLCGVSMAAISAASLGAEAEVYSISSLVGGSLTYLWSKRAIKKIDVSNREKVYNRLTEGHEDRAKIPSLVEYINKFGARKVYRKYKLGIGGTITIRELAGQMLESLVSLPLHSKGITIHYENISEEDLQERIDMLFGITEARNLNYSDEDPETTALLKQCDEIIAEEEEAAQDVQEESNKGAGYIGPAHLSLTRAKSFVPQRTIDKVLEEKEAAQQIDKKTEDQPDNRLKITRQELNDLQFTPPEVEGYRLKEPIGQGAFGVWYSALRLEDDKPVAIKFAKPGSEDVLEKTARMYEDTLKDMDHPNIVRLLDADIETPYVVAELENGINLRDIMEQAQGKLPIGFVEFTACKISYALYHAHELGIYHLDVKPENILIDGDGNPKLTDFGNAITVDPEALRATLATIESLGGTKIYASPEMEGIVDGKVDGRADIYGLGMVLNEMISGEKVVDPVEGLSWPEHMMTLGNEPLRKEYSGLIIDMVRPKPEKRCNLEKVIGSFGNNRPMGEWGPFRYSLTNPLPIPSNMEYNEHGMSRQDQPEDQPERRFSIGNEGKELDDQKVNFGAVQEINIEEFKAYERSRQAQQEDQATNEQVLPEYSQPPTAELIDIETTPKRMPINQAMQKAKEVQAIPGETEGPTTI